MPRMLDRSGPARGSMMTMRSKGRNWRFVGAGGQASFPFPRTRMMIIIIRAVRNIAGDNVRAVGRPLNKISRAARISIKIARASERASERAAKSCHYSRGIRLSRAPERRSERMDRASGDRARVRECHARSGARIADKVADTFQPGDKT